MHTVKAMKGSIAAVVTVLAASWASADLPPKNAKPLSEVAKAIEAKGYTLSEVSMDNGVWEVEAYKGSEERELKVHAETLEVLSDRPDH